MRFVTATLIAAIVFSLLPTSVFASTTISFTPPTELSLGEAVEVAVKISTDPNTEFSLKARLGDSLNSLTQGQTFSNAGQTWLGDTASWSSFDKATADGSGTWQGVVNVKTSPSATTGSKYLLIRFHKISTGTNTDSTSVFVSVQENSDQPPPPVANFKVSLTEIMPYPASGDEWVEIYNAGPDPADLTNWSIDDKEGGSSPTPIPDGTKVVAGSYYVLFLKNKLNNDTDSARILNPARAVIDSYTYTKAEKGKSFALIGSSWVLTDNPTPGSQNKSPTTAPATNTNSNKVVAPSTAGQTKIENGKVESLATTSPLPKSYATASASPSAKELVSASEGSRKILLIILGLMALILASIFFGLNNSAIKKRLFSWRGKQPPEN